MKLRTEGGHFWLTFDNGYTLSCFNGFGSHTENNFAIDFRPGNSSYGTGFTYGTYGNEYLAFLLLHQTSEKLVVGNKSSWLQPIVSFH